MCVYWACVAKFGSTGGWQGWLLWEASKGANASHLWDNRAKGDNCATTCSFREERENVRNSCADTKVSDGGGGGAPEHRFPCSLIISHYLTLIWLVIKLSQFPKCVLPETVTDEWSLPVLTLTHEPPLFSLPCPAEEWLHKSPGNHSNQQQIKRSRIETQLDIFQFPFTWLF